MAEPESRGAERAALSITITITDSIRIKKDTLLFSIIPPMIWPFGEKQIARQMPRLAMRGRPRDILVARREKRKTADQPHANTWPFLPITFVPTNPLIILLPWIILDAINGRPAMGHCELALSSQGLLNVETNYRTEKIPGYQGWLNARPTRSV